MPIAASGPLRGKRDRAYVRLTWLDQTVSEVMDAVCRTIHAGPQIRASAEEHGEMRGEHPSGSPRSILESRILH